ncbi:9798_t:CDS:1 [Paraglomus brasilianum]|uniref:9798_t:CDS:1 n=1 Tax=Paraglomus brasilianum TaxID=144538 RepID=A0A9N9A6R8_9GLOM|nr:9798_t:CDS:1 [Paraglomus brasilianum]
MPRVSFLTHTLLIHAPVVLLGIILLIHPKKLPSAIKRIIGIPLLAAEFYVGAAYYSKCYGFDILYTTVAIVTTLRFFDFYFFTSLLNGKDVYVTTADLKAELWQPIRYRSTEKQKSENGENHQSNGTNENMIVSSFTLLPSAFLLLFLSDCINYLFHQFTAHKILSLSSIELFIMNLIGGIYICTILEGTSRLGAFAWTLINNRGVIDKSVWKPLFRHPYLSTSLSDLWSVRWHQTFRVLWMSLAYVPLRQLIRQKLRPWLTKNNNSKTSTVADMMELAIPAIGVFAISGLIHEYIVWATFYPQWIPGQMMVFFVSQAIGVIIEKIYQRLTPGLSLPVWMGRLWILLFLYFTSPYFFEPFYKAEAWRFNGDLPSVFKTVGLWTEN